MKYLNKDHKYDSEECVKGIIEVIESNEVPYFKYRYQEIKIVGEIRNKVNRRIL